MIFLQKRLGFGFAGGMAALACATSFALGTNRFGFTGPEIFPIDNQLLQLRVADLDGDGLNDLVVVNNARSRINLLYNQTGKTNGSPARPAVRPELNQLPPDARFRIESIASEKRIASLVAADFNADQRADLAYYGDPKELVVLYNDGTNGWTTKRWPIEDGQISPNSLGNGDLNGDGRTDLVLLSENQVYFLPQLEDHALGEPQKFPLAAPAKSVQIADVDGDGRNDLLLVNWEDRNPFRIRVQQADGHLGPELFFPAAPIRSYFADNLETTGRTEVVTIALNSGRAAISEFVRKPAEVLSGSFRQGQLQVLPLTKTTKARRGALWADVNGDGLQDLLVSEPESGQISLCLQHKRGSLAPPRAFPTLAGISELAADDWDADSRAEIFMLSADEKRVGVTRFDANQRIPFPTLVPLEGNPLVMAVGRLAKAQSPLLAVVVEQGGKRFLVIRFADGKSKSRQLSDTFTSNPTTLFFHDADQDDLPDLVVLSPYEKVKILRQTPEADSRRSTWRPPVVRSNSPGSARWMWMATPARSCC